MNTKENTKEITQYIKRIQRKSTSIWIDPVIWKNFYTKCRNLGLSTCHILEPFMYAFNKGMPNSPVSALPTVNLTLNVTREVRRARRVSRVAPRGMRILTRGDIMRMEEAKEQERIKWRKKQ